MNFANVNGIALPEGEVVKVEANGVLLWQKKQNKYKTELAYLGSTGTQWIDTGSLVTATTDFEFVGAVSDDTKIGWIAGAPTWIGIHKKAGTVAITQNSTGMTYNAVGINELFTIGLFGDRAYFNGVETNTLKRYNSTMTLFLFAYHHTSDAGSINTAIRMHSFKIWDNGAIIRDFIPVLDWNDVACMYDKVSGELFYNQGTGNFLYE